MDAFVPVKVLERLAPSLYEQNNRLEMAKYEPDRHAYRLRRMPSGRFGYYREDGRLEEMWCTRQIEALIDVDGRPYWVACSIEFENKDYYVTRYYVPMDGLLVREPRGKEIYGIW